MRPRAAVLGREYRRQREAILVSTAKTPYMFKHESIRGFFHRPYEEDAAR